MRIYLCGPIETSPTDPVRAFGDAKRLLESKGHDVVNPLELTEEPVVRWRDAMETDLAALVTCDGVATVGDTSLAHGCAVELACAKAARMPVASVEDWAEGKVEDGTCHVSLTLSVSARDMARMRAIEEATDAPVERLLEGHLRRALIGGLAEEEARMRRKA